MRIRVNRLVPTSLVAAIYRAWQGTMTTRSTARAEHLLATHPGISCLWHDELFAAPTLRGDLPYVCIISSSRDGDFVGDVMARFGFRVTRGSSTRGGAGALLEMLHGLMHDGYGAGLTIDGPRGPRHRTKPGAIWLAAKTGRPLIPVRTFFSHARTVDSWDRFQIPLPFTTMTTVYGEPWMPDIDPASSSAVRSACKELDRRMESITEACING